MPMYLVRWKMSLLFALSLLLGPVLLLPSQSHGGTNFIENSSPQVSRHSGGENLQLAQQSGSSDQECAWLRNYVAESSVDGGFPLGPEQVTWSVASPPTVSPAYSEQHRTFVTSIIDELGLPVAYSTDQNNAHLFVYFHTKKENAADTQIVLSELRSSLRISPSFPDLPYVNFFTFDQCSISYLPQSGREAGRLSILIPFAKRTGAPIPNARNCVIEGLMKTFGIGQQGNGVGRSGWTVNCPRCVETDRRMALILAQNNKSPRRPMTTDEMFRRVASTKCH